MSGKLFAGALIVVSIRWVDRLLGLVSTVILARLLTPADFGIVAMASVVVGLIDVLMDLGVVAMLGFIGMGEAAKKKALAGDAAALARVELSGKLTGAAFALVIFSAVFAFAV